MYIWFCIWFCIRAWEGLWVKFSSTEKRPYALRVILVDVFRKLGSMGVVCHLNGSHTILSLCPINQIYIVNWIYCCVPLVTLWYQDLYMIFFIDTHMQLWMGVFYSPKKYVDYPMWPEDWQQLAVGWPYTVTLLIYFCMNSTIYWANTLTDELNCNWCLQYFLF